MDKPHVIVLAGPNGAGKSTAAPALLSETLGISEFVNADVIAAGLSGFEPERSAMEAGRLMLLRLKQLADERADFAFETTLASRSFAPWIAGLVNSGYEFSLIYLWLPAADDAVFRVQERVRLGGHNVPEEIIRRRYGRSVANFFKLYMPMATTWRFYDNLSASGPMLVAAGKKTQVDFVADAALWGKIRKSAQ